MAVFLLLWLPIWLSGFLESKLAYRLMLLITGG
jgi:hypothetical protein